MSKNEKDERYFHTALICFYKFCLSLVLISSSITSLLVVVHRRQVEAYLEPSRTSTMEPFCENSIQFSRYILREIPPMTCKVLARNLLSSKKLHIGHIVTFQRNIELYFEYNLDSYNFFELKKMIQNAKIIILIWRVIMNAAKFTR